MSDPVRNALLKADWEDCYRAVRAALSVPASADEVIWRHPPMGHPCDDSFRKGYADAIDLVRRSVAEALGVK